MANQPLRELVQEAVDLIRQQKYDQAIDAARNAIDEDPRDAAAYSALGIALASAGRLEEAVEPLQRAIQQAPYHPEHYYNLAVNQVKLGRNNEAIAMCQEAIRCDGKFKQAAVLLKELEKVTHTEAAPYLASIGDQKGSAYHYKQEKTQAPYDPLAEQGDENAPPPPPPPTNNQ
ncbi:MAG: hypothetical protein KatS3mg015_1660 [Fimbriimonadales bacterium]|nr:MAG: hypothetical protein KatS3mg015_1660 [Fimbriimonadales bacterium]